jgi:hypothetical protein
MILGESWKGKGWVPGTICRIRHLAPGSVLLICMAALMGSRVIAPDGMSMLFVFCSVVAWMAGTWMCRTRPLFLAVGCSVRKVVFHGVALIPPVFIMCNALGPRVWGTAQLLIAGSRLVCARVDCPSFSCVSLAWSLPSVMSLAHETEIVRQRIRLMPGILILDHNSRPTKSHRPLGKQTPQPADTTCASLRRRAHHYLIPGTDSYPLVAGVLGAARARAVGAAAIVSAHVGGCLGWRWVDGCECLLLSLLGY